MHGIIIEITNSGHLEAKEARLDLQWRDQDINPPTSPKNFDPKFDLPQKQCRHQDGADTGEMLQAT